MRLAESEAGAPRAGHLAQRLRRVVAAYAGRDPGELLAIAVEALGRYKLRTSLSILGVVLGIAAVIAMMSVSEGARAEALQQVEGLGLDNLVARNAGMPGPAGVASGLTAGDVGRLLTLVPLTRAASPLVEDYRPVSRGGKTSMSRIVGVEPGYQDILRLTLDSGRFLSPIDEHAGANVCVVGGGLARALFGYVPPVGERLRIRDTYFEVVGVLAGQGTGTPAVGALAWRDLDQAVIVPTQVLSGRSLDVVPSQPVDEIWLRVQDGDRVEEIGQVLMHTLARIHPGAKIDVVIPRQLLAQRYRTQRTFSVVVGSVAALALIVGGIGIMNIMLTSVLERTREIGIRRTVGATRRDVTVQFLTESLLMTLGGGVLGIVIGVIVSWSITAYAGWATRISLWAVGLAFLVSFGVGLGFGLYPAVKAAGLEPVDALHYE